MKAQKSRKMLVAIVLLLILAANFSAVSSMVARADFWGVGKFLTINIIGQGSVTATKSSGQTWTYVSPGGTEKVGAGTVQLQAIPAPGWEFSTWDSGLGTANPLSIKTDKYQNITATFVRKLTITASAGPNGKITPSGAVLVNYGDNKTFTFAPDAGYHVSAIMVDGVYVDTFATNYTFYGVTEDHIISVAFSELGKADVPAGNNVAVFLDAGAGLTFSGIVTDGGIAAGLEGLPLGSLILVWDIETDANFTGVVTIVLKYDDTGLTAEQEAALKLYRTDNIYDVNLDGKVNGADVSIVANANPSTPGSANWNPLLDLNHDGKIDDLDVNLVNNHIGEVSDVVDITTSIDTENNLIYGQTSVFSIFGVR